MPKIIQRIYALLIILIGWVFFRADNLELALEYIKNMFSFNLAGINNIYKIIDIEKITYIIIAIICSTPIIKLIAQKLKEKVPAITNGEITKKQIAMDTIEYTFLTFTFLVSIMYMTGSSYNPFIYFRF